MKEIDSDGLLLAKLQAETFSSSLKLNCSSEVFIRRFMNSKIAYELDLKIYLERIITPEEIINEITDEYGEFNYGKTKFNSEYITIKKPVEAIKLRVSQAKPNRYYKALPIVVKSDNVYFYNSIVYKKSLYGKKVLFIGDSITDMGYWVNWFVKLTGCIAYNRGVSGTTYTKNDVVLNSFCERLDKEYNNNQTQSDKGQGFPSPENVDLIIVLGGVNDFGRQSYINGKYGDIKEAIDNTTFCGALRYFFKGLKEKYTDTPIYALSMLHTYSDSTYSLWSEIKYEDDDDTKSYTVKTTSEGKTFYDYKNAIEEVSKMYGIEYIDMFRCGFSALITSEREKFYEDGLHPNELGGYIMAVYIIKYILN